MQERNMRVCSNCGSLTEFNICHVCHCHEDDPGPRGVEGINITDEQIEEIKKKAIERGEIVICDGIIHINLDMI